MPVTSNSPAPYAPASAILEIINRYRNKGLPTPITSEVLGRAGVSESLIPRTIQAMQTLDLMDASGAPSETFERLRLAPHAEFQTRLGEWLNTTYSDVLAYLNPATATEMDLRDAFRNYKPIGQQGRMVSLFSGLYAAAGIGPEKDGSGRKPRPKKADGASRLAKRAIKSPVNEEAAAHKDTPSQAGNGAAAVKGGGSENNRSDEPSAFELELLDKFPAFNPEWTEEIQAKWFAGFDRLMSMAPKR